MIEFNIAKEYSDIPGPRYINEGEFSGEHFRKTILFPLVQKAQKEKSKIKIILDGGYGYPTSFLEEAFGGIIRQTQDKSLCEIFEFKSDEEPALLPEIIQYMKEAADLIK